MLQINYICRKRKFNQRSSEKNNGSNILIYNDVEKDSKRSFIKRNVSTKYRNGSNFIKRTTNHKKLDKPHVEKVLRCNLKDSNSKEKLGNNESCTVRTYRENHEIKTSESKKGEIEERHESTGTKIFKKTVPDSYVRGTEFSDIDEYKKSDVREKNVPTVTWADIVNNGGTGITV